MTIKLAAQDIPEKVPEMDPKIRRAPKRVVHLEKDEIELALKNALRYIPEEYHEKLAPEFLNELMEHGRIYGYRFRPEGRIYGKPIDEYKGKCIEAKAMQDVSCPCRTIWIFRKNWVCGIVRRWEYLRCRMPMRSLYRKKQALFR